MEPPWRLPVNQLRCFLEEEQPRGKGAGKGQLHSSGAIGIEMGGRDGTK